MDPIKDIVHKVIGDLSEKTPAQQNKIQRIWENVIGEKGIQHSRVSGLKDGNLFIHVDSPAWMFQANLKKRKTLELMKAENPDIKNVLFTIGKVK